MKKIFIVLCLAILLAGCTNDCEKCEVKECEKCETKECDEKLTFNKTDLEETLVNYGNLIYNNKYWINDNTKAGTYSMTLKEMYEVNDYDISMFLDNKCKLNTTKIEFIVSQVSPKFEYKFIPVLDCKFN